MIVGFIAGEYVAKDYATAAVDGRIVQIGVQKMALQMTSILGRCWSNV